MGRTVGGMDRLAAACLVSLALFLGAGCGAGAHAGPDAGVERDGAADAETDGPAIADASADAAPDSGPACPGVLGRTPGPAAVGYPVTLEFPTVTLGDLGGARGDEVVIAGGDAESAGGAIEILAWDGAELVAIGGARTPWEPWDLHLRDLDADGDLDLVAASTGSVGLPEIYTLENVGEGVLGEPMPVGQIHQADGFGSAIAVADFDGDGQPEIASARNENGSSGALVLFEADGTEGPSTLAFPYGLLSAGDFDGDAMQDLVVLRGAAVSVWSNAGDGTFVERVAFEAPQDRFFRWGAPSVADYDADGDLDVATADWLLPNDGIGFDETLGPEHFALPGPVDEWEWTSWAPGDLDGDGDVDFAGVVDDWGDLVLEGRVRLVVNDGTGAFALGASVWTGSSQRDGASGMRPTAIGDVDADGTADLIDVFSIGDRRVVTASLGQGAGRFAYEAYPVGDRPEAIEVHDLDGDGSVEVLVAEHGRVRILATDGLGTLARRALLTPDVGGNSDQIEALVAADLDSDGVAEIIVASEGYDLVSLFASDGAGGWARTSAPVRRDASIWSGFEDGVSADLDGDGDLDLALAGHESVVAILWNRAPVDMLDWTTPTFLNVGAGAEAIVAADLDGDADVDLVTANSYQTYDLTVLLNDAGTFTAHVVPTDSSAEDIVAGDLDRDGDVDLVTSHGDSGPTGDAIDVFSNDGSAQLSRSITLSLSGGPQGMALADLDGDGALDLVVARAVGIVSVLRNDGAGRFGEPVDWPVGGVPFHVVAAELDGACGLDLLVSCKYGSDVVLIGSAPR